MKANVSPAELSITNFKPKLDRVLKQIMATAIAEAAEVDPVYAELLETMQGPLLGGGKRLRPYLTYLAYLGLGGTDTEACVMAAASQEFLHYFLLLHDDIIDRDLTRHGQPNVEGVYFKRFTDHQLPPAEALHYAQSFALLAGNAACTLGLQAISATPFRATTKLAAIQCVHRMLFEIMGGELTDVDCSLPGSLITPERLLKICHYKTATYSFQAPLQVGAILAGARTTTQRRLRDFGHHLGIAFQLTDDLLGLYGDEAVLGKPVISDLQEGKQTLLIYNAFDLATPAQAKTLRRLWGNRQSTTTDLATIQQTVRDCGAQAKTEHLAAENLQSALTILETIPLSKPAKSELTHLAKFCVKRQY